MEIGEVCQICGQQCCRKTEKFGKIALSEKDYQKIKEETSCKDFVYKVESENGWIYLAKIKDNNCIFLEENGKCSIHSIKPLDCRIYPVLFRYQKGDIIFFISDRCPFHEQVPSEYVKKAKEEAEKELKTWSEKNLIGYTEIVSPSG
jgi:Fe-S-cluster containining protein